MPDQHHKTSIRRFPERLFHLCLILFLSSTAFAQTFDLSVNDQGLISMRATQAPVEDLVTAIGEEMGIEVSFPSPVQERVTVDFEDLKLEQAIKQLTKSYILVTSKKTDPKRVREIIVMPEGEASSYLPEEGNIEEQVRMATEAAEAGEQQMDEQQQTPDDMAIQMDQLQRRIVKDEVPDGEDPAQMEAEPDIPEGVEVPEMSQ
ncbi:MAG: hypothetical protein KDJ38_18990 [Gammaproteobacteria bacterium]|nr:hypothetical protein [Gammaproteobacteria bacterium]